jgi:glutamate-ammonia-ligase adenylyltransferase
VEAAIREALCARRVDVARDARDMREKLALQFPGRNRWDLKFAPGGLVDIEFVAQTLQLQHAPVAPQVLNSNTIRALRALAQLPALDAADAEALVSSAKLQQALTQVLRIAVDGTLDPAAATAGLKALLVRAGGAEDFSALEKALAQAQHVVRAIFDVILPAK